MAAQDKARHWWHFVFCKLHQSFSESDQKLIRSLTLHLFLFDPYSFYSSTDVSSFLHGTNHYHLSCHMICCIVLVCSFPMLSLRVIAAMLAGQRRIQDACVKATFCNCCFYWWPVIFSRRNWHWRRSVDRRIPQSWPHWMAVTSNAIWASGFHSWMRVWKRAGFNCGSILFNNCVESLGLCHGAYPIQYRRECSGAPLDDVWHSDTQATADLNCLQTGC